jgi:hypothetical protein
LATAQNIYGSGFFRRVLVWRARSGINHIEYTDLVLFLQHVGQDPSRGIRKAVFRLPVTSAA